MFSSTDYAWAAGFLDGEGCFTITCWRRPSKNLKHPVMGVELSAAQVDQAPLIKLMDMFGGSIHGHQKATDKHSESFKWVLTGAPVITAIEQFKQYLTVKAEVASILVTFREVATRPTSGGGLLSDTEYAIRLLLLDKVRTINSNGRTVKGETIKALGGESIVANLRNDMKAHLKVVNE